MLNRIFLPFENLIRRPVQDWLLLAEAIAVTMWVKLCLFIHPFNSIRMGLGISQAETLRTTTVGEDAQAKRISWAVQTAARYIPIGLVCLPQAIAAGSMLNRRNVPFTLYLGVKLPENADMMAHAWLRAGTRIVTGADAMHGHTTVASFARLESTGSRFTDRIRSGLGLGALLATLVFSLTAYSPIHDNVWWGKPEWIRQAVHEFALHDFSANLAGFSILSLLLNFALNGWHRAPLRFRIRSMGVILVLFAGTECIQIALNNRNFDIRDIQAALLAVVATSLLWVKPASI